MTVVTEQQKQLPVTAPNRQNQGTADTFEERKL